MTPAYPPLSFGPGADIAVLIPLATGGAYDYRVADAPVQVGDFVTAPLGKRSVTGVVLGPGSGTYAPEKIKPIMGKIDMPPLPPATLIFLTRMAEYTLNDPGAVLKLALPVDPADGPPVISKRGKPLQGTTPHPDHHAPTLTPAQQNAAQTLTTAIQTGGFTPLLLDGVTGAGKTEVYFEAVAESLRAGRQVLILQPEIALTTAFVERFKHRFGQEPALWHSGLTPAQRRKTWWGVLNGEVRVVAGARSALMLPYPQLGAIIVDEEHEAAYKQEEGVLYHARDMAVMRAHIEAIPIILSSATPSLETMANVWAGKYAHVMLPDRFGGARLPETRIIDLRVDKPERGQFIAPFLYAAMNETLARGEQVLLFLNRRGYAPLTLCRTCGHRLMCPRCTAWMVEHRRSTKLHCHHCGYTQNLPPKCPSCGDTDSFVACGPGVERVAEEAKAQFPTHRVEVLSSDLMDHPAELSATLTRIAEGQVDIIVGTQIIAKGHHFPNLTLVGVIDADLGLSGGDLRAAERTFQLLHQVGGRAGRADKPGRVFLQTYMADNKVMQALATGARDPFLELESSERQAARMPPFARLVGMIISGKDESAARALATHLARIAPTHPDLRIWGPAEAPLFRIRGQYRFRLLVQAGRNLNVQKMIADWVAGVKIPANLTLRIDIDPQSFL